MSKKASKERNQRINIKYGILGGSLIFFTSALAGGVLAFFGLGGYYLWLLPFGLFLWFYISFKVFDTIRKKTKLSLIYVIIAMYGTVGCLSVFLTMTANLLSGVYWTEGIADGISLFGLIIPLIVGLTYKKFRMKKK